MTKSEREFRDSLRVAHEEISNIHELMQEFEYDLVFLPWAIKFEPDIAPQGMMDRLQDALDVYRDSDLLYTTNLIKVILSDCLKRIGEEEDQ